MLHSICSFIFLVGGNGPFGWLSHVDEKVNVVPLQVLVLDQPLKLLLDHLFGWQELVLEDVD